MEKIIKILTDPTSNILIQLIRIGGRMTISEILEKAEGIPRATVYRKIDRMLEAGIIEVVDTNKVRGQTENIYSIKNIYVNAPESGEDGMKMMTAMLLRLYGLCDDYFKREDADVERDKLFAFNYVIRLSDEDFSSMLGEMYEVVDRYQRKGVTEAARLRNIYLLSMPTEGEKDER